MNRTDLELRIHRALNSHVDQINIDGCSYAIKTTNGNRTLRYNGKLFIKFANKKNPNITKQAFLKPATQQETFVIKSQCTWGVITNTKTKPLQDFSNE